MNKPLAVCFDDSASSTLRRILTGSGSLFTLSDAAGADVILFGTDEIAYVDRSPLYRAFAAKCLCVTESDIPTFRLPGLYAANEASILTAGRTETIPYILSDRDRPNLAVGALVGQSVAKRYLYSFMGSANSWPRKTLVRLVRSRPDTLIETTHAYRHWTDEADAAEQKRAHQARYAEVMAATKFALCPRGCGLSSYRLFESMMLGVAPVIISDRWRPMAGIDWSFALFLRERQIPSIDTILRSHADEWRERGRSAAATFDAHLRPQLVPEMMHARITRLLAQRSAARERIVDAGIRLRSARRTAYWKAYGVGKRLLLAGFTMTGIDCPVPLVPPIGPQVARSKGDV